jgi:hypothetical protein
VYATVLPEFSHTLVFLSAFAGKTIDYLEIYDTIIMYDYVQKHPHKYVITELIRSMK